MGASMTWYARQRQAWIGEMLTIYGFINRRHIVAKFGCSAIQAGKDLTAHAGAHPFTCIYDKRRKAYVKPNFGEAAQ